MFDLLKRFGSSNFQKHRKEGNKSPICSNTCLLQIEETFNENKIPVLIHGGALYGMELTTFI